MNNDAEFDNENKIGAEPKASASEATAGAGKAPDPGWLAALPAEARQELNERIARQEDEGQVLAWLNELPAAKDVQMAVGVGTFTAADLAAWRATGFAQWQERARQLEKVRRMRKGAPSEEALRATFMKWAIEELGRAWVVLHNENIETDPEGHERRVRQFCQEVLRWTKFKLREERRRLKAKELAEETKLDNQGNELWLYPGVQGVVQPDVALWMQEKIQAAGGDRTTN